MRKGADDLGYTPNPLARGLRMNRTQTIGVVSDSIFTTPFANRMVEGAQKAAWEAGYLLLMLETGGNAEYEARVLATLEQRQVDGLLLGGMYHRAITLPQAALRRPTVALDYEPTQSGVPSYVPAEYEGARTAVQHLLDLGHRRIAHITEAPSDGLARQLRMDGWRDALRSAGCLDESLLYLPVAHKGSGLMSPLGERAGRALLSRPDRPTAIFAFNDRVAAGVFRAAAELGLRIPDDLSVVGFDDQNLLNSIPSCPPWPYRTWRWASGRPDTCSLCSERTSRRSPWTRFRPESPRSNVS